MGTPTSAELTLLRTRPQSTKLWLSIYEPEIVFQAQVSGSLGLGGRVIAYDNVTFGSYVNIENGMTMYVHDVATSTPLFAPNTGKIRVRSATASDITVAENTEILWTDNQYITVVRYVEINAVFPRIIQDPGDPTNTLWYKDYDIAYTNQNDMLGAFVCMGSHYAGFIGGTGTCQVYYTASGTSHMLGSALTYNWFFQGALTTGSSSHTPGYISYDTPGHYETRLTVTSASGTSDVSYRYISIYDRPGEGPDVPILRWSLKSLQGSRDGGGYTASIAVYERNVNIVDGALVVIFADDWYGDTRQSVGGALNRQSIVFVGYVLDGSVTIDYKSSTIEFQVGSPTEVMKQVTSFAVGVNSSASPILEPSINADIPSSWAAVLNMNVKRAMYHYLRWHSTVLMTNDLEFTATDQNIQYFDADRESLYDGMRTLMEGTLAGEFVCDRNGKIWAEPSVASVHLPETVYPTVMIMDKQDWVGTLDIDEVLSKKVSYLEMGGIAYPGPGFSSTPLLACSPGTTPAYRGDVIALSGLGLASQAQLNTLVGDVFYWKNARFPNVKANLAGNYRHLDIAPIELVQLNMSVDDNIRNISWSSKYFAIQGMDWSYNSENQIFLPHLELHERTRGVDGQTITIPPIPPTTAPGGGGFSIPTFQIPPIPSFQFSFLGGGNRPEFIQAVGSSQGPAEPAGPFDELGVICTPSVDTEVTANLYIPADYTGVITIAPIIVTILAGSPGNLAIDTNYFIYPMTVVDTEWTENVASSTYTVIPFTPTLNTYQAIKFTSIPVTPNSFVSLDFVRYNNGDDTYADNINMVGWRIWWS